MSISEEKLATENFVDEEENERGIVEEEENKSEHYLFIVLFYFLGTVCFIPSSFFITANKYWMYKFRDPSLPFNETDSAEKTDLQKNFTAYSGITGNVGTVAFLFVTILLREKIGIHTRIIGSMVSLLVFFAFTLMFIFIDTDSWQTGFFVIVLLIAALLHCGTSVLLVSVFQLALKFQPRCLGAQFAGQSVCGIFAAALQVFTLMVASSIEVTTSLYYSVATGAVACVLIGYIVILKRSTSFQERLAAKPKTAHPMGERPKLSFAMVKRVFWKLRFYLASLAFCVGNTLILQPGLTILMESSEKGSSAWGDTYFLPVCVFLLSNTFEFIGRETSNFFMKYNYIKFIFGVSVIRLVLFPLILMCNLQPRHHLPVWFYNDAFFIIFIIILAFSNGYLLNVSLVKHAESCEPEEKWLASATTTIVMLLLTPIFLVLSGVVVNVI